ncbi:MAG: type II toxin-antitoxin system VapC family toxin [Anaerolineae bacterium]|nr:type II toxin-antitoxin system VapC family toxin [Anaerolineae bacterium]
MILLDTNILIEFYKNNTRITKELRQIGQPQLAISVITQAELYYGAFNKAELNQIKKHLSLIHIFPLDPTISSQFVQFMELFSLSHKLAIPDALIAATAVVHGVELYTLNLKDFRFIPHIRLYTPVTD